MKQPLIEALKELGRLAVLAVIPALIAALESPAIDWKAVAVIAAIAVLKVADKYIHERTDIKANGIVPF